MKTAKAKSPVEKKDYVIERINALYAVKVPDHAYTTMKTNDPQIDPVARQYVPTADELAVHPYERQDPIGDNPHSPVKGIVHRYPARALYKITNICPVYCRYCFRKTMVGPGNETLKKSERQEGLSYLKNTPEINEVILTGGDPLILSPAQLTETLSALDEIKHIKTVRIHTRTPIASPDLITDALVNALNISKPVYMVLHVNHKNELTDTVQNTIKNLRDTGIILLSQSVLLKGVNDTTKILADLLESLVTLGVKPYMLHHLDAAPGTHHFRTSLKTGMDIMQDLRGQISGLSMPEYMLDIPGGYGKVPINQTYVRFIQDSTYEVTDYQGQTHIYKDEAV